MEKIINDNVHGLVVLHPLLNRVVDRPAFQRLRNIAQLGLTTFVYPTASHSRFEHSLGTAQLAGRVVRQLQTAQAELQLDERDVLAAEAAGLLHDLGHGPFSHLWDGSFVPVVLKKKVTHEELSLKFFDIILDEDDGRLRKDFASYGLDGGYIRLIKEMILGGACIDGEPLFYANSPKQFLYEIISNKRTGFDVDKLDYLVRDTHALGISYVSLTCDLDRVFRCTRVVSHNGISRLAHRDKEVATVMNFFVLRRRLHSVAYQHRVCIAINLMFIDALILAEPVMRFAEAVENPAAFLRLTDHIFWSLLHSTDPALKPSQHLLNNILCRRLYRPLLKAVLRAPPGPNSEIRSSMLAELDDPSGACEAGLRLHVCCFKQGSTDGKGIRLLTYDRRGRLEEIEVGDEAEWEVRLYVAHLEPATMDVEELRAWTKAGEHWSTSDKLSWAFCRWASRAGEDAEVKAL